MNVRIQQLKHQASLWCDMNIPDQFGEYGYGEAWEDKFAELIVRECINTMLNTDEQKFVVETEGWELGGANHGAWERGVLDAVSTVKEYFGVEE
jgi:hypothetical protein